MSQHAVVTLAIGHQSFWRWTHRVMALYCDRIGADFVRIDQRRNRHNHPLGYRVEKLQIRDLLDRYERVLFFDGDILIHPDCPDLFELTPTNRLGVVCEGKYYQRQHTFQLAAEFYGVTDPVESSQWFNTGVMVISREQRDLFLEPDEVRSFPAQQPDGTVTRSEWIDMPLLNCQRLLKGIEIIDLGLNFNYLGSMREQTFRPFEPEEASIFHGSGSGKGLIPRLVRRWYGLSFFLSSYTSRGRGYGFFKLVW
ncbi:MAG: hypothetical protein DRQ56_08025 [Gammaproteobacteria bacterium]|nr:MAG: hypothetical protein DRQ56_08025 [Gammaproteobacteria bacterium]